MKVREDLSKILKEGKRLLRCDCDVPLVHPDREESAFIVGMCFILCVVILAIAIFLK